MENNGYDLQVSTVDYLFIKYRSMTVTLEVMARDYYPHLKKAELLKRANGQEFPFSVFKLDKSKRAPFLVHVRDLAEALDKQYEMAAKDHATFH
jgi:hypothetical protein